MINAIKAMMDNHANQLKKCLALGNLKSLFMCGHLSSVAIVSNQNIYYIYTLECISLNANRGYIAFIIIHHQFFNIDVQPLI